MTIKNDKSEKIFKMLLSIILSIFGTLKIHMESTFLTLTMSNF